MPVFLLSAICGLAGAIAAHIAYVQSNLYILGDVTRRGRHIIWDPLAFDLLGLLWGVVAGIVTAELITHFGKASAAGLAITLLGVAITGGVATVNRYRELYSRPQLTGLVLEFELRLPTNRDPAGELPDIVELDEGEKTGSRYPLSHSAMRVTEGRIIMPGVVPLRKIAPNRLLTFPHKDSWHAIFTLLLHDTPVEREHEWTDWESQRVTPSGVAEKDQFQLRYRVQTASNKPIMK